MAAPQSPVARCAASHFPSRWPAGEASNLRLLIQSQASSQLDDPRPVVCRSPRINPSSPSAPPPPSPDTPAATANSASVATWRSRSTSQRPPSPSLASPRCRQQQSGGQSRSIQSTTGIGDPSLQLALRQRNRILTVFQVNESVASPQDRSTITDDGEIMDIHKTRRPRNRNSGRVSVHMHVGSSSPKFFQIRAALERGRRFFATPPPSPGFTSVGCRACARARKYL